MQADLLALLIASHRRIIGRPLVDERLSPEAQAAWLDVDAPFGVLAHDSGDDPRFTYANLAALSAFEYPDDELIGMPSRLTAAAPDQAERQRLLDAVAQNSFMEIHRTRRIAKSGRRFWIESVTIWTLRDEAGATCGQAAAFRVSRNA